MIRKIIAIVLLVGAIFTLSAKPVMAFRPPYTFGAWSDTSCPARPSVPASERVIHINDNAALHGTNLAHVSTTQPFQDYEYGSFLGVLTVERLGRTVNVYGGATMDSMDFGAGHFSFTGLNIGNTALIGHNRGARNGFFSFVRLLREGDVLTLDMGGIVRSYSVTMTSIVYETDFSYLQQFGINRLTLVHNRI